MLSVCGVLAGGPGIVGSTSGQLAEPQPASRQTAPIAHRFSGTGPVLTDAFTLKDGVTTVEFDHDGESSFRAELVGDDMDSDEPLVEEHGATEGGCAVVTEDDSYVLEITADGAWTVECEQPAVDGVNPALPPYTDSGTGVNYAGPVLLSWMTELTGTHHGDGSFSVWAYTADGSSHHLIEAGGTVEESTSPRIEGATWFDVDADGKWQLEVI